MIKVSNKILLYTFLFIVLATLLIFISYKNLPDKKLHVYFLDVDQGDAILIVTPTQHKILVDGGPYSNVLVQLGEVLPFHEHNIDLLILTHPHSDHVDGLVEVIKRYNVKSVLVTGVFYQSQIYLEFLESIQAQNVNYVLSNGSFDLKMGEVKFDLLFPDQSIQDMEFKNINNSSLVFKLEYGKNKLIFTGDMEVELEHLLLETGYNLEAEILKVGHHGSKTASGLQFLEEVQPKTGIISLGQDNKFNHPHQETLENLEAHDIQVFRTDQLGRIELECDEKLCEVKD